MEKGKCGIYLWFFAAFAFVLALLGQVTLCALLLGFVLVVEKNEWLTRQAIQAFGLVFVGTIVSYIFNIITPITDLVSSLPVVGNVFYRALGYITNIVDLIIAIFAIIAIIKVVKGKEAELPLLSGLADKAFGIVRKKVVTQAQPVSQPQPIPQPMNNDQTPQQ